MVLLFDLAALIHRWRMRREQRRRADIAHAQAVEEATRDRTVHLRRDRGGPGLHGAEQAR